MNDWGNGPREAARRDMRLAVAPARGAQDFRAARRHSRLVRVLRIVIPAVVLVGAGGFMAMAYVARSGITPLTFSGIDMDSNSLTMENPQVSGFSGEHQSYALSADRAIQNLQNPRVVTLEGIDARLGMDTGDAATLGAGRGIYDSKAETLVLRDGITVKTTTGYQATLKRADIDLKAGTLQASEPIELRSADGSITGNEVEITESGKRIIVRKGVSMTINSIPTDKAGKPREAKIQ